MQIIAREIVSMNEPKMAMNLNKPLFLYGQMRIITKGRRFGFLTLTKINFLFFIKHDFYASIGFILYISMCIIAKWLGGTEAACTPGVNFTGLHFYNRRFTGCCSG
jgi:hypothetical protein